MLSIVQDEPLSHTDRVVSIEEARPADEPAIAGESDEFEIVLGRRQIASVLFVATLVFGAFSSIAYLAGKSVAPKPSPVVTENPVAAGPVVQTPATIVKQAEPVAKNSTEPEPPLWANPKSGAIYLQIGAVEKGVAIIMAEGLRKRSLPAFVAPGPNDHIFRVLIGPLDTEQYKSTKDTVEEIGLSTFARKYQP